MASRRDFLKGLFAASIASQMPDITPAKAEVLADAARRAIRVDIDEITDAGITKYPRGWYRVWVSGRINEVTILTDRVATYKNFEFYCRNEKNGVFCVRKIRRR